MLRDSVTLAFLGDAVYELAVRRVLIARGGVYAADKLHRAAVRYVRASAQAKALRGILAATDSTGKLALALRTVPASAQSAGLVTVPSDDSVSVQNAAQKSGENNERLIGVNLDEEALTVVRRARNHKPKTVPKNADPVEYKMATALEALIGYLTLEGRDDEAQALIGLSMQIIDGKE
jgi:ribonuclease-3 family protein